MAHAQQFKSTQLHKSLVALLCLCAIPFANLAFSQNKYDFFLSGDLAGQNGVSTEVYVWSEDDVIGFAYKGRNCGGRLFPIINIKGDFLEQPSVQMIETVDYGFENCGLGNTVSISPKAEEAWTFERLQKFSFPEFSVVLTAKDTSVTIDVPPMVPTPQGAVIADPFSGLTLGKGKPIHGVGPTSLVLAVRAGSPAFSAGVVAGDRILSAMGGAGSPGTHVAVLRKKYGEGGTVDLWLQNTKGERRTAKVILPAELNEPPNTDPESISIQRRDSEVKELLAHRRFDDNRSALGQLTALAGVLGIAENEVSEAIADGHLNPNLEDLKAAYLELPGTPCEEIYQKSVKTLFEVGEDEFARNKVKGYRKKPDYWCPYLASLFDDARISAWNKRFGPKPAGLSTLRTSPTVMTYFDWNDVKRKEYAQLRCDFTASLKNELPKNKVFVDCGSLRPTFIEKLALRQMSAAQRDDVLGPARDLVSWRIRLFADGSFEALKKQAIIDMRKGRANYTSLIGRYDPNGPQPTYAPLISSYASARLHSLGSCGDPLTSLTLSVANVQSTRTISGIEIGRNDLSYSHDFKALSAFAPVIIAIDWLAQPGAPGWGKIASKFSAVFANLECNSEERVRLEKNMLAYLKGEPPAYDRDSQH